MRIKSPTATVFALEKLGANITLDPDLTADKLPEAIKDSEILIVRSTKVNAATIEAATSLSLIIRAGAGVNTIDLDCASSRGIHVANTPGKNTHAVAELALGLLIAADRRIVNASQDLQAGKWRKKEYGKAKGLKNRTLGIIGLGSIGKALVKRAQGLEMNVIAWSRSLTEEAAEEMGIGYCDSPEQIAEQSDAISVHLAAKPETSHFIGKDFLNRMKDGAILINTSRGEVVDTTALKSAIKEKQLRVGLDVFENEPAGGDSEFADVELAGLITCTPHIGASTDQAAEAIADGVVQIVESYKQTGKPINAVNVRKHSSASVHLVVRHFNRVGVLVGVLEKIREQGINIEEMENTIFENGKAATCTLLLDKAPSNDMLEKARYNENVIQVTLKA